MTIGDGDFVANGVRKQQDGGLMRSVGLDRFSDQMHATGIGRKVASDLAEYRHRAAVRKNSEPDEQDSAEEGLSPGDDRIADYDRRITEDDLRTATRSRFVSEHYPDAVEAGVKALNECVRAKSGSIEDGDPLMTSVFSEKNPKLRINRLKSQSDRSEQRGHMMMCQGVIAAWRNPRAHSSQFDDEPETALMMLETIQHLMSVTKQATRTRRSRNP